MTFTHNRDQRKDYVGFFGFFNLNVEFEVGYHNYMRQYNLI